MPPRPPIHLHFVLLPDTLLLDLAGPAEAFRLANDALAARGKPPAFALHFVGPETSANSSVGLALAGIAPLPESLPAPSWVMLLGRPGEAGRVVQQSLAWLTTRQWLSTVLAPALDVSPEGRGAEARALAHAGTHTESGQGGETRHRLVTVCAGALLAADAGLLAGRQVTSHHEMLGELARLAPAARVCANRVFVADGPVWSSAGITAGIDLALHLIAEQLGEGLASAVAQVMVVFHRRGSEDPEQSPLLAGRRHLHPAVHAVQNAVVEAPGEDWTLERLAALAHVTPRHLTRLFQLHAGLSPRAHVEQVRLALATEARASGFGVQQAVSLAGFSSERQWRRAQARRQGLAKGRAGVALLTTDPAR